MGGKELFPEGMIQEDFDGAVEGVVCDLPKIHHHGDASWSH